MFRTVQSMNCAFDDFLYWHASKYGPKTANINMKKRHSPLIIGVIGHCNTKTANIKGERERGMGERGKAL